MTLKELNENYSQEIYINEGLKFFKKSDRLIKYADKIDEKNKKKNNDPKLSDLVSKMRELSKEYSEVEQRFANKEVTRGRAKELIEKVNKENEELYKTFKTEETKSLLKTIGLAASISAIMGILASLSGIPVPIIAGIRSGANAIGNVLLGKGAKIAKGVAPSNMTTGLTK